MTHSLSSTQARSGVFIDPFNLRPEMIKIEDVACSLAKIPRFNGHLRKSWSVAQHSLVVSALCPAGDKFAGLMHDAPDMILGDLASPIKYHPKLAGFLEVERDIKVAFSIFFGYQYPYSMAVHAADLIVRYAEADQLHHGTASWPNCARTEADEPEIRYARGLIVDLIDMDAQQMFLSEFRLLNGEDIHAHL